MNATSLFLKFNNINNNNNTNKSLNKTPGRLPAVMQISHNTKTKREN